MSSTPGPAGQNSRAGAARTPAPLGINDAGSPDAPAWLLGDTPGPLGVNDHAGAIAEGVTPSAPPRENAPTASKRSRWAKLLDSLLDWEKVSGPPIAWVSPAHGQFTREAARAAPDQFAASDGPGWFPGEALPPRDARRRLLLVLDMLPTSVVAADITLEQYSDTKRGHSVLSQAGQATHFMANKGQSQRGAYAMGIEKVFGPTEKAVALFKRMKRDSEIDGICDALGEGVHALQDSFSPAHVQRSKMGDKLVIMRILVWGDQQKKDHEAGDESWKDANANLTELGQACKDATIVLLTYFILAVVNKDADAERQRRLLMEKYLSPADPSRSGW